MTKNPFTDPNAIIDYGLLSRDVDLSKPSIPLPPRPPAPSALTNSGGRILTLDDIAAENGATKTQNDWIPYWNAITDGRRFATAADMYTVLKQMKSDTERGIEPQKQHATILLASLRKDWEQSWQVMGTRIIYEKTGSNAKILHDYGRPGVAPSRVSLEVPEWLGVPILEVLSDRRGLPYLQAFFGTTDSAETIVATLEYAGGKPKSEIKIWTPPLKHDTYAMRKDFPEWAAGFDLGSDGFRVDGDGRVGDDGGRSRGVR